MPKVLGLKSPGSKQGDREIIKDEAPEIGVINSRWVAKVSKDV
jgi:hypothetical protein